MQYRPMKNWFQSFKYLLVDFASALLAWLYFYKSSSDNLNLDIFKDLSLNPYCTPVEVALVWVFIYAISSFYIDVLHKSRIRELFVMLLLSFMGVIVIFFVFLINNQWVGMHLSVYRILMYYWLIHFNISVLAKMILMSISKHQIRNRHIYFNTLLIGANIKAKKILDELETKNIYLGLKFNGFLNVGQEVQDYFEGKLPRLGNVEDIESVIKKYKIEQVVIAIEPSEHIQIAEILTRLEGFNIKISIIPDVYQMLIGSVSISHVLGMPLIEIKQDLMPTWQSIFKRTLDIVASACVLIFGFPFFVIVAIITQTTSKGKAIYKQERIGKHGVPFQIFKFRSMYEEAEKQGPALSNDYDPRITPWGRFMRKLRIDEMPQFYNVLIGEMSLVGPRPERQFYIDQIVQKAPHYKHIIKVKPGITSLGMVKFGYAENVDQMIQRLEFDIIYIENMSLLMDFRIMIYTTLTVLSAKGK